MVALPACGARWGRSWPGALRAAAVAVALVVPPAGTAAARSSPAAADATERPHDPNDAPMMAPRGGQAPTSDRRLGDDWSRGRSSRRRVALSLAPIFASYRLGFIGRPVQPIRGGGLAVDVDVQLFAPLWLRLGASYSAHALFDQFDHAEGEAPKQTARRGVLQSIDTGAALLLAMDLGRVRPMLEAGAGISILRLPRDPVQDGQLGAACLDGGGCDVGLFCATDQNVCRQGVLPRLHAGAGIEVLVADHFSVGVMLRYFALLLAPTVFPVYLQTGVRATLRF